ncbi:zona pellucida-like domain-containing protein 1 [Bombina bombina]|uniref:zona pellucida-like domain-containing protein 1 n=1 Tax=Bombina bombina TaxID=8345 RepID=UPI00235A5C0C|nr:zona pellucida-like domain-containing protein 1 [Bombina bombina]
MVFSSKNGMQRYLFYIVIVYTIHEHQCFDLSACNGTFRAPEYSDILVNCGPQNIELYIFFCPVIFAGYNETQLYMNDIFTNPACQGIVDTSGTIPFLKYTFSINESSTCGSLFTITTANGEGDFKDFSNIQTVNISGIIKSKDPNVGVITYSPELKYLYSCNYPLEYLMNNTRLDVAGNNVAINANNGSFISTLTLQLFVDSTYSRYLSIPTTGIKLNSTVYVEVKAVNLTEKFNVLLDRCYASTSPYPANSTYYDLFIGCPKDKYTVIISNGLHQYARFSFSAFRFLEQYGQPVSTFYLHCITRLCETASCANFIQTCPARRRRDVRAASSSSSSVSEPATITSPGIITSSENDTPASSSNSVSSEVSQEIVSTAVGLGIAVGFLALLCTLMGGIAFLMHRKLQKTRYPDKNNFH